MYQSSAPGLFSPVFQRHFSRHTPWSWWSPFWPKLTAGVEWGLRSWNLLLKRSRNQRRNKIVLIFQGKTSNHTPSVRSSLHFKKPLTGVVPRCNNSVWTRTHLPFQREGHASGGRSKTGTLSVKGLLEVSGVNSRYLYVSFVGRTGRKCPIVNVKGKPYNRKNRGLTSLRTGWWRDSIYLLMNLPRGSNVSSFFWPFQVVW